MHFGPRSLCHCSGWEVHPGLATPDTLMWSPRRQPSPSPMRASQNTRTAGPATSKFDQVAVWWAPNGEIDLEVHPRYDCHMDFSGGMCTSYVVDPFRSCHEPSLLSLWMRLVMLGHVVTSFLFKINCQCVVTTTPTQPTISSYCIILP